MEGSEGLRIAIIITAYVHGFALAETSKVFLQ